MSNEVYIAGIDLGTTNSCIGCIKDERVEIICNELGSRMNPSMVAFTNNGTFYGEGAKHFLLRGDPNTIYGVKRIIGQNFSSPAVQDEIRNLNYRLVQGPNDNPRIFVKVGDEENCYPPEVISSMVIRYLVDLASKRMEHAINKIVITCPAYFNEKQRRATRDAGEIAGYEVIAVLNEPAAAAIAYGYNKQMENKTLLVYDLGGGTFDITVFRMNESEDQVLGYSGDSHCGGIDLDRIMEKILIRHIQSNGETIDLSNPSLRMKLRHMAEEVKITLSSTDFCDVPLEDFQEFTVTREEFIQEAGEFFAKTIRIVKDLLAKLSLSPADIDEVLLVGGSSNIPQVATELSAVFGESKVSREINVEEAVTYGATLYAYHQCRCKDFLSSLPEEDFLESFTEDSLLKIPVIVMDVVPISYGIEVMNHKFSRIVEANTPLNKKKTKLYQTNYDNQRELTIIIYQGEEDDCRNDVVVGQFVIRDLPGGKAGKVKVEVTMEVDFEFTLHVHAKVMLTGQELGVTIQKGVINLSKVEKEKWKKKRELDRVNSDRRLQRTDLVNEIKSCLEIIQEQLDGEGDSFKAEVKEDAEDFLELCSPEALSAKSISELEELLQQSKDWVSYLQFVFGVCSSIRACQGSMPVLPSCVKAFVSRGTVFSSLEDIQSCKKGWPLASFVEQYVSKHGSSIDGHPFHLGLDVSSKSTGVCVLSDKGAVVHCGAIKPNPSFKGNSILVASDIFQSIQFTIQSVDSDMTKWNIVEEKYLQKFGNSHFRTQGLFYLAEINGILQYKLWELTGTAPLCIHPSTARSLLSLRPTSTREETKEEVLRYVRQTTGTEISWPKKKRSDGFAEECYDMADAYVLARYALARDHAKQLIISAKITDDLRESLRESTLFSEFVKIHIAHFAQKYCVDEKMYHMDTIPLPLLEMLRDKLEEWTLKAIGQYYEKSGKPGKS